MGFMDLAKGLAGAIVQSNVEKMQRVKEAKERAYDMTASQLARKINSASGPEKIALVEVAKERGDVYYDSNTKKFYA